MAAFGITSLVLLLFFVQYGEAILCHRCFSSMGGCGDDIVWRMYPWRECGSEFCVKVIEKIPGEEPRYLRGCLHDFMKFTRHRLQMPVLRRHGYCLPARVNNPLNPLDSVDSRTTYCFCDDWNGCNSAISTKLCNFGIVNIIALSLVYMAWRLL